MPDEELSTATPSLVSGTGDPLSTAAPSGLNGGRDLEEELEYWNTTLVPVAYDPETDVYASAYYLSLALGCLLVTMLVIDLLISIAPRFLCTSGLAKRLFVPSGLKAEAHQQKAAFFKTSQMLQNALHIHTEANGASNKLQKSLKKRDSQGSQVQALLQYQLKEVQTDRNEEVGGLLWTWKKILNGSLAQEEGVWIHSRLLACTMAQAIIVSTMTTFLFNTRKAHYSCF